MPTGYTYNIKNGISFQQFVMNCARAFGACVELRDEKPGGDVIPERFEPDNYSLKILKNSREELDRLSKMSLGEAERVASEEWTREETARLKRVEERRELLAQYENMLSQVKKWKPPSPDHTRLKEFMVEQIQESIKFDCSTRYDDKPTPRLTASEWLRIKKEHAQKNIEFYQKSYEEDVQRAFSRTKWISDLRESIK